jgi:integrase
MTASDETARRPTTFAEAWHAWFDYRCGGLCPLRLGTIDGYESSWRCHIEPRLGATPLTEIDGVTIARPVVDLSTHGLSPMGISKSLAMVRACLRWHYRMGTFAVDPTPWFDAPPPLSVERTILTLAQVERLIAVIPEYYRPMVTFSAYTGVRLGELTAITWADIDFEKRTVRIDKSLYRGQLQRSTKSGYNRVVPIPIHVVEVLREYSRAVPTRRRRGSRSPTRRARRSTTAASALASGTPQCARPTCRPASASTTSGTRAHRSICTTAPRSAR